MARECEICGKKTTFGRQYSRRGLAKKKGGNGRKITGKASRTFKPNVQRMRVLTGNGTVKRMKVCTRCLKSGRVAKPGKMAAALDAAGVGTAARKAS